MEKEEYPKKYIGKKYGMLTIMSYSHRKSYHYFRKNGKERIDYLYFYKCKCDCGKEKIISINSILNSHTKSCGCLHTKKVLKHGESNSKLYFIWRGMKERCFNIKNKRYKIYGGRGIKVCDEWIDKENGSTNFINWALNNGYQEKLSIDRIDVNGNYCPENCRWVTMKEQANNTRVNIYKEYNGVIKTLSEWSDYIGVKYKTFWAYVKKRGLENALNYYGYKNEENNL